MCSPICRPPVGRPGASIGIDDAVKLPTLNVDLSRGFSLEFWLYLDSLPAGRDTAIVELGTVSGAGRITLRQSQHRQPGADGLGHRDERHVAAHAQPAQKRASGCIAVTQEAGTVQQRAGVVLCQWRAARLERLQIPANVLRDNCWIGQAAIAQPGGCGPAGRSAHLCRQSLAGRDSERDEDAPAMRPSTAWRTTSRSTRPAEPWPR